MPKLGVKYSRTVQMDHMDYGQHNNDQTPSPQQMNSVTAIAMGWSRQSTCQVHKNTKYFRTWQGMMTEGLFHDA